MLLYYILLRYIILYCNILYCIISYYIILYYIISYTFMICIMCYIYTYNTCVCVCVHYVPASFQPALLLIASSTHPTPSAFAPPRDRVAAPWGESLQMTWVDGWFSNVFVKCEVWKGFYRNIRNLLSKISRKKLSAWKTKTSSWIVGDCHPASVLIFYP